MARPRTYDPLAVRQRLLGAFHQKGFEAASLSELETASGLNRRQLYDGFGDKADMFKQALDDFADLAGREFLAPLEQGEPGLPAIRTALKTLLAPVGSERGRLGCLICNTAREPIASEAEIQSRIDAYFRRIRKAYLRNLTAARDAGALPASCDPDAQSRHLLAIHVALCVLARAGQTRNQLTPIAEEALRQIGA